MYSSKFVTKDETEKATVSSELLAIHKIDKRKEKHRKRVACKRENIFAF